MAVRFQGDPTIQETGSGQGPTIPLDQRVAPTSVEMLNKDADDQDDPDDEGAPAYSRENIGARIGQTIEEAGKVEEVAAQLDADDVVPVLFRTAVNLQDKGIMHHWAPGVHLVPVSLAGDSPKTMHRWLKDNKCRHAGKRMPRPEEAA